MRQPIWKTFLLCLLILSGPSAAADIDRIQLPAVKAERVRPLVAIVADNAGTETTDLVVPYGVLKSADVADIVIVSTQAGTINLMPALAIESDMTMETFDKVYPAGADVLIVPAMHDNRMTPSSTGCRSKRKSEHSLSLSVREHGSPHGQVFCRDGVQQRTGMRSMVLRDSSQRQDGFATNVMS